MKTHGLPTSLDFLYHKYQQKGNMFLTNMWSANARLNKYHPTTSTPIIYSHYHIHPQHRKHHTPSNIQSMFHLEVVHINVPVGCR